MVLGTFGGIVFETSSSKIKTFGGLTHRTGSTWALHNVIGSKAKSEYTGPDLASASFEMVLSVYLGVDVNAETKKIRGMASAGSVDRLIIGCQNLGKFKITSATETWNQVDNKGNVISAKISVEMEEYV